MKLLNLGCGSRFHPAWTNVDTAPADRSVMQHDLREGVPFPDGEFDAVYHSHVLEHLPRRSAGPFLAECLRVLRPGGVIRVAVPDLERVARDYLHALELAAAGDEAGRSNYEWVILELYDQTVRDRSGGEMGRHLSQDPVPNRDFILERIGLEGRKILAAAAEARRNPPPSPGRRSLRESAIRRLLGPEYALLELGRFRDGGEIHQWMYDRHSLAEALTEAGFAEARPVGATESRIPEWTSFDLDTEPDGTVCKPDSLFMEAVKS